MTELNDIRQRVELVLPAVAEKELVQAFTHIHFYPDESGNRVQASNGMVTVDAPCEHKFTMDVSVPAKRLAAALQAYPVEDACVLVHDAERQRVTLRGKHLRTALPVLPGGAFPRLAVREPATGFVGAVGLLQRLRTLLPFAAQDATRPWAQGVRMGPKLRATNNSVLVEMDAGVDYPQVTLPLALLEVLDAMGMEPSGVHVAEDYVLFRYPGDVYLRSKILPGDWPEVVEQLLARCDSLAHETAQLVPAQLERIVTDVARFSDDSTIPELLFTLEGVRTPEGLTYAVHGGFTCSYDPPPRVRLEVLKLVLSVAQYWELAAYPLPIPFDNDEGLRGVFIGLSPWAPKKEEAQ